MLKFGIIGVGRISLSHLAALMNNDCSKVQAVADIDKKKATDIAAQYEANAYNNYIEMVNNEELDAVVINLPHYLHCECTVYCAEHGLHVLLEKPMAVCEEECKTMILAAEKNNIKLMIGHVQRYYAENIKAKEIIQSGELGEIAFIVENRNSRYFSEKRPRWFLQKQLSGGGAMMNFGAHSLDKIIWLTDSEIKHINGKTGTFEEKFDIEGHAQAFIELENGVTAVISYSGYNCIPTNETKICFSKGEMKLCTGKGLWISREGEYEEIKLQNDSKPFELQMNTFIDCILDNKEIPIPGIYGMKIIKAIESVYSKV